MYAELTTVGIECRECQAFFPDAYRPDAWRRSTTWSVPGICQPLPCDGNPSTDRGSAATTAGLLIDIVEIVEVVHRCRDTRDSCRDQCNLRSRVAHFPT